MKNFSVTTAEGCSLTLSLGEGGIRGYVESYL